MLWKSSWGIHKPEEIKQITKETPESLKVLKNREIPTGARHCCSTTSTIVPKHYWVKPGTTATLCAATNSN
jgi:hypothetical protein